MIRIRTVRAQSSNSQKIGDNFGIRALLHRNGKAEGEAVGVDRFGDYLRMNLDVRSEMARK